MSYNLGIVSITIQTSSDQVLEMYSLYRSLLERDLKAATNHSVIALWLPIVFCLTILTTILYGRNQPIERGKSRTLQEGSTLMFEKLAILVA